MDLLNDDFWWSQCRDCPKKCSISFFFFFRPFIDLYWCSSPIIFPSWLFNLRYKLILTSLLVSMGLSTFTSQNLVFFGRVSKIGTVKNIMLDRLLEGIILPGCMGIYGDLDY